MRLSTPIGNQTLMMRGRIKSSFAKIRTKRKPNRREKAKAVGMRLPKKRRKLRSPQ
jgi:hypothetical protein